MKVMTILGTRPEIIRLSQVIAKLDQLYEHIIVHTGQNYDRTLNDIFFAELRIRSPDCHLGVKNASFGEQIGQIVTEAERVLRAERPDRVLILGDTNSGLSAIVAKRMGIPVYHMEAGNRCFDDRVPEEINRRLIDHSSDILMPYTARSRHNLLREGISSDHIFVTGNPIYEVLQRYDGEIANSNVRERLNLTQGQYFLVTLHREENVDVRERLASLCTAFEEIWLTYEQPIVISTHPRTHHRLSEFKLGTAHEGVRFMEPFGFHDFISLERGARCVLTDSGTVQEECAILGIPNVTLRDVTERAETVECGSNVLSGADPSQVMHGVNAMLSRDVTPVPPREYTAESVSNTVVNILTGH